MLVENAPANKEDEDYLVFEEKKPQQCNEQENLLRYATRESKSPPHTGFTLVFMNTHPAMKLHILQRRTRTGQKNAKRLR